MIARMGPQSRPPPPPGLAAVLFDLGGTLVDYLGGAPHWPLMERPGIEALHHCLAAAGFPVEAEAFHESFIRAIDQGWRAATEGSGDPPTLESLIRDVCAAVEFELSDEVQQAAVASYCEPIAELARMVDGAPEVLSWLRGHGIKLAVLSNTLWPAEAHRLDLSRYELLHYFDLTLFSTETRLWKPDPRFFGLALERLGVEPSRAAVVGDRLAEDIDGAHRAGLRSILLEGTQDHEDVDPNAYSPDVRIASLKELPKALVELWS